MKNILIKYALLLVLVLGIFIGLTSGVSAAPSKNTNTNTQTTSPVEQPPDYNEDGSGGFVPCGNKASEPCNISHLFRAFVVVVNYMITMVGFVAVVAIAYAGFAMVVSQGEANLTNAKKRLSGAIIGLVLVGTAFVLVNSLFEGSMSVGVKNGGKILSSPLEYIKEGF